MHTPPGLLSDRAVVLAVLTTRTQARSMTVAMAVQEEALCTLHPAASLALAMSVPVVLMVRPSTTITTLPVAVVLGARYRLPDMTRVPLRARL